MELVLRSDYIDGIYNVLNKEKLESVRDPEMTLGKALDLYWNSVRIEGNICYKNCYTCDPEYDLDSLSEEDLDRKIWISSYDLDEDGYPICFAEFNDD